MWRRRSCGSLEPGQLRRLAEQPNGSFAVAQTIALPAETRPIDVAKNQFFFVLDAATSSLLAFPSGDSGVTYYWGSPRRLPVGANPVALSTGCLCASVPNINYVAVANAGSDDLSIYTWTSGTFPPSTDALSGERRVAIAGHPSAFATSSEGFLAVAGGSAGTVTLLKPNHDFAVERTIAVGGDASDIERLRGRSRPDLVVADASAARVRVLPYSDTGYGPARELALPNPGSTANSVATADLNADDRQDIVVADRAKRSVTVLAGRGGGRFGPGQLVRSGVDPAAIAAGDFGGDVLHFDVAIADTLRNEISLRLSPGDPQIVARARAENLSADRGLLTWSERAGKGRYRLAMRASGATSDVPIRPSAQAFAPRVGRLAPGRPAIAYVACRRTRCATRLWDVRAARERTLPIHAPPGCRITTIAVWDGTIAYDVQGTRGRRCRATGVWVKRRYIRAVQQGHGILGDLRDGLITWISRLPEGFGREIHAARLGERDHTLAESDADCNCGFEDPRITRHTVIYGYDTAQGTVTLNRLRPRAGACQEEFADADGMAIPTPYEDGADFAIDGAKVFYVDQRGYGVFQADPGRVRWKRDCIWPRW